MKKPQKILQTLKNTKFMFDRIWNQRTGKGYILLRLCISILESIFSMAEMLLPGMIINELIGGKINVNLLFYVSTILLLPITRGTLRYVTNDILSHLAEKITEKNWASFYRFVMKINYEFLGLPSIQDQKNRASRSLDDGMALVWQLGQLLGAIIKILLISSVIAMLNPVIIILVILTILADSAVTKRLNEKNHETENCIWDKARLQWGFGYMLDAFEYAKELRLFQIGDLLIGKFLESEHSMNRDRKKMETDKHIAAIQSAMLRFLNQLVLYVYLIYKVFKGGISVGNMTIYLSAAGQFSSALAAVMDSYLSLSAVSLRVDDFQSFFKTPTDQCGGGMLMPYYDENSVIEFKNVSFCYHGSKSDAIHHLNLTLRGNEKLCIIGENGAGKSTFIKLLMRIYLPTEGEILLNGINIIEYDYESYQRLFAPVFQDFVEFYMTVCENIVLDTTFDRERFVQVCNFSGVDRFAEKLHKKYDTQVNKWFDESGVIPSGGEGQRIAIARACYHGGMIYLLDEPTAALDPNAEYEMYQQFSKMTEGKGTIYITHRISAVQLADKIAVFADGNIAEYGTHGELYKRGRIYTEMFDKQAEFYRGDI